MTTVRVLDIPGTAGILPAESPSGQDARNCRMIDLAMSKHLTMTTFSTNPFGPDLVTSSRQPSAEAYCFCVNPMGLA